MGQELKTLSIRHEAIMDYMMANPTEPKGMVAKKFGVTPAWLSSIIHSSAFQSRLAEKGAEMFEGTIIPLRDKMLGVAHRGLERLGERIEAEQDTDKLSRATLGVLDKLGYGSKQGVNVQVSGNNAQIALVSKDDLLRAQDKMQQIRRVNDAEEPIALPETVSAEGRDTKGQADRRTFVGEAECEGTEVVEAQEAGTEVRESGEADANGQVRGEVPSRPVGDVH